MCGGYLQRKRPIVPSSRMGAGIALMLLAQCSPERQVLFSDTEAPNVVGISGVGGAPGGGPAVGIGTGGSNIGAGPSVGGTGGSPCLEPEPPTTCAHGFEVVMHLHSGCALSECGPVNECNSNQDCPSGSVCFAGVQCDDDCASPECCSGNHCASASCPALANVTCLAVGCPAGDVCSAACDSARCTCDGASWNCTYDAGATTNCPSACALP
jgi:hypothetical protein